MILPEQGATRKHHLMKTSAVNTFSKLMNKTRRKENVKENKRMEGRLLPAMFLPTPPTLK